VHYAIGGDLNGHKIGIVNNEVKHIEECFNSSLVTAKQENYECKLDKVSCRFINQINETIAEKVRN
jgi:hypothetical protein